MLVRILERIPLFDSHAYSAAFSGSRSIITFLDAGLEVKLLDELDQPHGDVWYQVAVNTLRISRRGWIVAQSPRDKNVYAAPVWIDDEAPPAPVESPRPKGRRPVIRRGSRSAAVQDLQSLLKLQPDGIFGGQTERAVRRLQIVNGLPENGIAATEVWNILDAGEYDPDEALRAWLLRQLPRGIDKFPGARAARYLIGQIGRWVEDEGANRGHALTPELTEIYRRFWQLDSNALPWCMMAAARSVFCALLLGDPNSQEAWKQFPLGGIYTGGAWQGEKYAIEGGFWIPAGELRPDRYSAQQLCGSIVIMARTGSGSDAGANEGPIVPGQPYSGHACLFLNWLDDGKILTIGGNEGDAVDFSRRRVSSIRGIAKIPGF